MDVSNISQDLKRRIKRWSGSGRKLLQVLKGLSSGALLESSPFGYIRQESLEDIFSSGVMLDLRNKINKKRLSKQCMDCLCDVQNVQQKHERDFEIRFREPGQ